MNTQTELKKCTGRRGVNYCNKMLPVTAFNFRDKSKGIRAGQCYECKQQFDVQRKAIAIQIKKSFIRRIEKKAQCIVKGCSARNNYKIDWAHFDHIEPSTKIDDISRLVKGKVKVTLEDLLTEIHKCNIVCAVHHQWNTKLQLHLQSKWANKLDYYTIAGESLQLIQDGEWAYSVLRKKQNDKIVIQAYQETLEKEDLSKAVRWS